MSNQNTTGLTENEPTLVTIMNPLTYLILSLKSFLAKILLLVNLSSQEPQLKHPLTLQCKKPVIPSPKVNKKVT